MGKTIQKVAEGDEEVSIVEKFDPKGGNYSSIADYEGDGFDIYVDFTVPKPEVVLGNVEAASTQGIDSVIGTTGWYEEKGVMREIVEENNSRVVYAPNFSIGTNLMFAAADYLSSKLPEGWDVSVDEKHHTGKADAPSGTGKTLGNILVENLRKKEEQAHVRRDKRSEEEVDVVGIRVGSVAGEHEVNFVPENSYDERLQLIHNSFGTEAFAQGALKAAKWLNENTGLEPGLYNFKEDILEL